MGSGCGLFKEIVARKACVGLLELQRGVIGRKVFLVSALSLQTLPGFSLHRLFLAIRRWLTFFLPLQTNQKEPFLKTTIPSRRHHLAFALPFLTHQPEDSRVSEHRL